MDKPYLIPIHLAPNFQETMVIIRGYTSEKSDSAKAFQKKADLFLRGGWQGSIYALWWDASKKSTLFYTLTPLHWHKIKARASKVGKEYFLRTLAPILDTNISITAHSLGARVAYYGLLSAQQKGYRFKDVILLGGAIRRNKSKWPTITTSLQGRLFNLYSNDDIILKTIYRTGEMEKARPCGYKPFEFEHPKVRNINISKLIEVSGYSGHWRYWDVLPSILRNEVCSKSSANR